MTSVSIAIPSIYETEIGIPLGKSGFELMSEAALGALRQIGLGPDDVDACLTSPLGVHPYANTQLSINFAEYMGFDCVFEATIAKGGGSTLAMLEVARGLISTGKAKVVLLVNGAGTPLTDPAPSLPARQAGNQSSTNAEYSFPYGIGTAVPYALLAQRHMYEHGTSREQIAQVVVTAHEWGRLAGTRGARTLTVDDVLASPTVLDPFTELEMMRYVDGCAACVVTSAEFARDLVDIAPIVLGLGTAVSFSDPTQARTLGANDAARLASQRAYEEARIVPGDVDMFANYDAFPTTQIIALEALQFAAEGKGGEFVQEGHTAPGGSLPTSTNGGMTVQGHPVLSASLYSIAEAARQLRGQASGRQIDDCDIALHANYIGASGAAGVLVLGREAR